MTIWSRCKVDIWNELTPRDRLRFIIDLSKFFILPQLQAVSIDDLREKDEFRVITINLKSDEDNTNK